MNYTSDTQELVATLYKDETGSPIILTPNQDRIFRLIAKRETHRAHIMCHTRFGKSLVTALAILSRVSSFPEKWAIVAGTKDKAAIIMNYIIAHIFDNDITASRFSPDKGETLESIRRYRNKNHLTFKIRDITDESGRKIPLYGEVYIGSASEVMGKGAKNIVEDESALIDNDSHSFVTRMLGDDPFNNYLIKIGNPFNRNHFLDSYHDPAFTKINIDCYKSLKEGRMSQQTIDENRSYRFFPILFENKFTSASEIDESGWMYLSTDADITNAQARKNQPTGTRRIGHDVARGGRNYNAWVLRTDNYAKVIDKDLGDDLIKTGDKSINFINQYGVSPENFFIDDSGVGGGETDYVRSQGYDITPVNFGEGIKKDIDASGDVIAPEYINMRAMCYAGNEGLAAWIKQVGQLEVHKDWIEATKLRFRKNSTGKIVIESKEDMRKRGIESPDVVDALALTFADPDGSVYYETNIDRALASGAQSPFGGVPFD